jgi:hypothetical protein
MTSDLGGNEPERTYKPGDGVQPPQPPSRIILCGPPNERVVHACFDTRGLPQPWEQANDGRWMHVDHGDPFAATVEQVTCRQCQSYLDRDREAVAQ